MIRTTQSIERGEARIRALRASGLLHHRTGGLFDDEIALVCRALRVPVAVVSLIEEDRQVFAAQQGLPEPWASQGEMPLTHSFCQHVVEREAPFSVPDAYDEPLVEHNLAVTELGVRSYLGVPLALPSGEVVGAIAGIGTAPRHWTEADLSLLQSIASVAAKGIRASFATARRSVIAELGDRLRAAATVAEAGFIGAVIMARTLGGARAGYGVVDADTGRVEVRHDWCATGVSSVAGIHDFRDCGAMLTDLRQGRNVIVSHVETDQKTAAASGFSSGIGIAGMIALPIMEHGRLVALTFVHQAERRSLSRDDLLFIETAADRTQAAIARLQTSLSGQANA